MSPEDADKRLRELLAKAVLPPELCASDPDSIEAMLDALDGDPFSEEEVERILKKAKGELPVGPERPAEPVAAGDTTAEAEEELLALHRGGEGELPSDIEEKLRRYREKAQADSQHEREEPHGE